MKIFLIRHGETDYTRRQYTTGHVDIPLNETGRKEAKATASYLNTKTISKIFSSSLSRANETAKIIASELNLPVIEYDELMEHTSGELDGVPLKLFFDTLKKVGDFEEMVLQAGGEPKNHFRERIWNKFHEIIAENYESESILIVAHGQVNLLILTEILNSPFGYKISQKNCCVNIINYDKEKDDHFKFIIELVNYTDHII